MFDKMFYSYSAKILWAAAFSYFLQSRNLCYHHHVNVIFHSRILAWGKWRKKNVIYFGTLFSASSRWEQKGVTSAKTPPTGITNKSACRWSGEREKSHERKIFRSTVTLADWAGEWVGRRYAEIMTQHDLRCCYGHCYWRGFSLGKQNWSIFFSRGPNLLL